MEGLSPRGGCPGRGVCGGINFVLYMYIHTGNDIDLEDNLCGGIAPQGYVTPAPPLWVGEGDCNRIVIALFYYYLGGLDRYTIYVCIRIYKWIDYMYIIFAFHI